MDDVIRHPCIDDLFLIHLKNLSNIVKDENFAHYQKYFKLRLSLFLVLQNTYLKEFEESIFINLIKIVDEFKELEEDEIKL